MVERWTDWLRPSVAVTRRSQVAPGAPGYWMVRLAQPEEQAAGRHGPLVTSTLDRSGPPAALLTVASAMPKRHSGTLVAFAQDAWSVGGFVEFATSEACPPSLAAGSQRPVQGAPIWHTWFRLQWPDWQSLSDEQRSWHLPQPHICVALHVICEQDWGGGNPTASDGSKHLGGSHMFAPPLGPRAHCH